MISINGTNLFVDQRGPTDGPPLLFVHGGPGNACWDFMTAVGDQLADSGIHVIGVDQRGVLRSDPLPQEPPLTVNLLIQDFEALRSHLGLDRWAILGHSAGAGYAFDYAIQHPEAISQLILDCPSLDADATDRYRLPKAAELLDSIHNTTAAERCRQLVKQGRRITADDRASDTLKELGTLYGDLFLYTGDPTSRVYSDLMEKAPDTFDWSKGGSHGLLVADMYRNRAKDLKTLTMPSMLIHGRDDLVAAPKIIDQYRSHVGGPVITIDKAGHFPYIEQPNQYLAAVAQFVTAKSP